MNIHSSFDPSPNLLPETTVSRVGAAPVGPSGTVPETGVAAGDATHLSPAAVLAAASSSLPEVRQEKIAAVQQSLASGAYAVSPSDVAEKLIDHLLQN